MTGLILTYLVLILIAISIFWTISRGAPWVPSSMKMVHKMLRLADLQPDELLYDLGCGDGRIIITAALRYRARAVGIELDPLRFLWCKFMIALLGLREKVKVHRGDFYDHDLSSADVVACFLLPQTNKKLEHKLLQELDPGTRVISNTFLFNQVPLEKRDGKACLFLFSAENTQTARIKKQLLKSAQEQSST